MFVFENVVRSRRSKRRKTKVDKIRIIFSDIREKKKTKYKSVLINEESFYVSTTTLVFLKNIILIMIQFFKPLTWKQ